MTARSPEQREDLQELDQDGIRAQVGLRCVTEELIAGGPIDLEFSVAVLEPDSVYLAVGGDRSRQRPGQFILSATIDGTEIGDPMAGAPDLGGPLGVVEITKDRAWAQQILLNQFLALETLATQLDEGESGRLELTCRRPLALSRSTAGALKADESPTVTLALAFDVRRDDAALEALILDLAGRVAGSPATREHPLAALLSLRGVARDQIVALAENDDPLVADRARHVLDSMD